MKTKKRLWGMWLTFILVFGINLTANAMHIMEGFLSPAWSITWGVVCVPFLIAAFVSLKKKFEKEPKSFVLLALCGAFAFVLSALKIPSLMGSCSHPTGVALGAILFGPFAMSLVSLIVLLFQAILLAHGGITTLGANNFSMGIAGPIVSFVVFKGLKKAKLSTGLSVFFAALLGDLATYVVTAVQLALAHPENGNILASLIKFLSIFALTQIPLAVCEGLVTVVVFGIIEKYGKRELKALNIFQ